MSVAPQHIDLDISLMVVQWQGHTAEGETTKAARIADKVISLLRPLFKRIAAKFTASARGSLGLDDLEQVAALTAFKLMAKYAHERRGSMRFEDLVRREATSACDKYIRMRAHVVHVGDWSARKRRGGGSAPPDRTAPQIEPTDVPPTRTDHKNGGHDQVGSAFTFAIDTITPESLLSGLQDIEKLREVLGRLTAADRELICDVFGIGKEERVSLRSLAERHGVPRSKLAAQLEDALKFLRFMIERE